MRVLASIIATSSRGFSYNLAVISSSTSISMLPLIFSKRAGLRAARMGKVLASTSAFSITLRVKSATLFHKWRFKSTDIPFKSCNKRGSAPSANIS